MAKRIEIKGNYFYLIDTETGRISEDHTKNIMVKRHNINDEEVFITGGPKWDQRSALRAAELEKVNTEGQTEVFGSVEAFMAYIEPLTGFNGGGGSGLGATQFEIENLQEDDALLVSEGKFKNIPVSTIIGTATNFTQGYFGLLSSFYFGGDATETVVDVDSVNTWFDVLLQTDPAGTFDKRPKAMKDANDIGIEGDGTQGNPIVFLLEGLDTNAFANFRASMSFEPEEDEGQLESRLLFNRHTNSSPSNDFPIEEVSLSMQNGANKDYTSEPLLTFFVGDTIDTNAKGDAGKCRFQFKTNVHGT